MAINVFGAGAVQTAYVGYRSFAMTANTTLYWPNAYQDTVDSVAAFMRVSATSSAGLILTLPDATQVSVGQNFIIVNTSLNAFSIYSNTGTDLGSIDVGISYYYILENNSTAGGTWRRETFGAGNADVDAAELAGLGLDAVAGKLNTSIPVFTTVGPSYVVSSAQNASLVVWEGGSGTITLPNVATVDDGFYFSLNNEGSGEVVVSGNVNIDNQSSFIVGLSQSLTFVKAASAWWTIGFGQQTFFAISVLNKSVAGNTNVTLSASEATRNIQQYSGVLTGNITVFFPVEANEWTIYNNTTGPFTLSVQLAGPTGSSHIIPQSNTQIYYSDGTTMRVTPSVFTGSTITFADGTSAEPSIAFTSDDSTGLYLPSLGQLGISAAGAQRINVTSAAVNVFTPDLFAQAISGTILTVDNGTVGLPSLSFFNDETTGSYLVSPGTIGLSTSGVQRMSVSGTAVNVAPPIRLGSGSVGAPSLSFTGDIDTGLYQDAVGEISIGINGVEKFVIDSTSAVLSTNLTANALALITPLSISNGGTASTTAPQAINALMPVSAAGALTSYNGTNWVTVAAGTEGKTLKMTSGSPQWTAGSTIQYIVASSNVVTTQALTTAFATISTLTLNITLASVTSKVYLSVDFTGSVATNDTYLALFRGAVELVRVMPLYAGTTTVAKQGTFLWMDSPGALGPHTYSLRAATKAGVGTLYINADSAGNLTGLTSYISAMELGGI
jgi:hypothetical protein